MKEWFNAVASQRLCFYNSTLLEHVNRNALAVGKTQPLELVSMQKNV